MKSFGMLRTFFPDLESGFTRWNLLFSSIVMTGTVPQIYPIVFCTSWGIFVSFNVAPLLDKKAFRNLATILNMRSMFVFHIVCNFAAHAMPYALMCMYPPKKMRWWSGVIAASAHLGWGVLVSKGTMLLDKVYVPMRPEFWALMWSSAIMTELSVPFVIYPLIKKN